MEIHIKNLKEIIEDYENNKSKDKDSEFIDNLWEIYDELNRDFTFKPKVLKLIKNYDEYFDINFEKNIKNDIIKIINEQISYHPVKIPQQISIEKYIISNIKVEFDTFLCKLGFINSYELNDKIYYIWKF